MVGSMEGKGYCLGNTKIHSQKSITIYIYNIYIDRYIQMYRLYYTFVCSYRCKLT